MITFGGKYFLSLLVSLGHVQLTYFCSWSDVEDSCDKEAIANMYCAPGETNLDTLIDFLISLRHLFHTDHQGACIFKCVCMSVRRFMGSVLCRHVGS